MKKSVLFAAGLAVTTAAMIPFSSASRTAYHAYMTAKENQVDYNRYSEARRLPRSVYYNRVEAGESTFAQSNPTYARYQRNSRTTHSRPRVSAERVSDVNTTYVEKTDKPVVETKLRPFVELTNPTDTWREDLRGKDRYKNISPAPLPAPAFAFRTYQNDAFSMELPTNVQAVVGQPHTFSGGDMNVRVKHFAAGSCDQTYGFYGCATNITRAENAALISGLGQLIPINPVVRQSFTSDTLLDQLNQQTNVYSEAFASKFPTGGTYTLYRYVIKDVDNGLYYLEIKVPYNQARDYVGTAKRIFNSFRIYPQS